MPTLVLALHDQPLPPPLEAAWLEQLPAARRRQLGRWPDADARRRSLLGNRLLREGLRRLGQPLEALSGLHYPAHGRPQLDLPLDFSLSHCEGEILCALSTQGAVGVDVERPADLIAAELRLYLSARERAWAAADGRRLCMLWTRKEAIAKAAGTLGLRQLPQFEVLDTYTDVAGRRWSTSLLPLGPDHLGHLAGPGTEAGLQFEFERIGSAMLL